LIYKFRYDFKKTESKVSMKLKLIITLFSLFTIQTAQADVLLLINGSILNSDTVQAKLNDNIIVINKEGKKVATNTNVHRVISNTGLYAIQISKKVEFNGTELGLQLKQGDKIYQLLRGENPATFTYNGAQPFPAKIIMNLTVGKFIRAETVTETNADTGTGADTGTETGGDAGTGDTPPPATPTINTTYDVNNDGKLTQEDITAVKKALLEENIRADVNNDGIINTRDIIEVIKAVRKQNRPGIPKLDRQQP